MKFIFPITLIILISCNKEKNLEKSKTWYTYDYNDIRLTDISVIDNMAYIHGTSLDTVNSRYVSHLYKTNNSGNSWGEVEIKSKVVNLGGYKMFFVSDEVGFLAGYYDLFKTSDGGITWDTLYNFNTENSFSKIAKINSSTIIGYFGRGNAYISFDLGENWSDYSDKLLINPTEMDFIDNYIGYAICDSKLYKSLDGGENWSKVADFKEGCTKLDFYDENHGAAIIEQSNGDYSTYLFYMTDDGGLTWNFQDIGADELFSILYENIDTLYLGTGNGILISTDGGHSWKTDYKSKTPIWSIDMISDKIIGVGDYILLLKH